jgi:predicted HTH transcriptional regulator
VTIERTVFVKLSVSGRLVVRQVVGQVISPVKLTERQQVILGIIHRFVVEHVVEAGVEAGVKIPSALSIAKQIDISSRTVQRELAYLQAQGIIRRVGADFSGHWEIIEK